MNHAPDNDEVVTSLRNPQVVAVAGLHDPRRRRGSGLTLVEGPHQVSDVVAAGAEVRQLYLADGDGWAPPPGLDVPTTRVSPAVLRKIAGTEHPRGPVAVVAEPMPTPLRPVDTVVLWDLADPGNVGAICRSAAAFGFSVAVTPATADPWGPKSVRAAAGAQFRTRISLLHEDPIGVLSRSGLQLVATVATGGVAPEDLEGGGPVAVLIGNEAHGLPVAAIDGATPLTIPLQGGVESLNAAAAAAVVIYALTRRRRQFAAGSPGDHAL